MNSLRLLRAPLIVLAAPLLVLAAISACEPAASPPPAPIAATSTSASVSPSASAVVVAPTLAPSAMASAPASAGPADPFAKVEIKAEKVAGSVYVLYGQGGNIGASVGDDGIVLVDDQFAPLAAKIQASLASITDKPIRVVLNTHWHGDHTGGNAIFGALAPIVAQDNVRKRLESGADAFMLGPHKVDATPPAAHLALPVITFADTLSVHYNGEEIHEFHIPHAHTDGDSVVYFVTSKVVHTGDVYINAGFPIVDHHSGGSVAGMIVGLKKILAEVPADVAVIPGHGKVTNLDDVRKVLAMIEETRAIVAAGVKKKQTLAQLQAAKVLAKYDAFAVGFLKTDDWIATIYEELTAKEPAKDAPKK